MNVSYFGNAHGATLMILSYITFFQNLQPKIKLAMKHIFKELTILDILIENQNGQIYTEKPHRHSKMPINTINSTQ